MLLEYPGLKTSIMTLDDSIEDYEVAVYGRIDECPIISILEQVFNRDHDFSQVTCEYGTFNCVLSIDKENGWQDIVVDTNHEQVLRAVMVALYDNPGSCI